MNWREWHFSSSLREHLRYYSGNPMNFGEPKTWGVVQKQADGTYAWAVYVHGQPPMGGTGAASVAAAKRDADRAEVQHRLDAAEADLAAASAVMVEARRRRDEIRAELGPRRRQRVA